MKREIIKKYQKEFDAWLNKEIVVWFYQDELEKANSIEDLYDNVDIHSRFVKEDGFPFTSDNLNIVFIVSDFKYEYRLSKAINIQYKVKKRQYFEKGCLKYA